MSDFLNGRLDNTEIRNILKEIKFSSGFKPSEKLMDDVISSFSLHDFYNSFISDKIYLDLLIKYLDENKSFNRFNYYKFFFDEVFKDRENLRKFALVFESKQVDRVLLDAFLDEVKNFQGLSLEMLQEKHLVKVEMQDEKDYAIWQHHTITEFLVAELILAEADSIESFKELSIKEQEGITAFKLSWSGVLRFLMESSKGEELTIWLIKFLSENPDNTDNNLSEILVLKGDSKNGSEIFELIYNSYFERVIWLTSWLSDGLSKFINASSYKRLKNDIKKWKNETETFVRRGNAVSVIGSLFESKSKFITPLERKFWKEKLITFANDKNENGVLQRHSLYALGKLHEASIIPLVSVNFNSSDSLVRDAFIEFCIEADANTKEAINYFVEGVKVGSTIYGRHGLYFVKTKSGIQYLLSKIAKDDVFLKDFLENESIFDKDGADNNLMQNIEAVLDKRVLKLLKQLLFSVFNIKDYYQEERSKFLRWTFSLIGEHDKDFLFEVLNLIKGAEEEKVFRLFYDFRSFLALLLTEDNIVKYFETIDKFPQGRIKDDAKYIVSIARRTNGGVGDRVYEKAVSLKLIEKIKDDNSKNYWERQESKRKRDRINDFKKLLEPASGRYSLDVFSYYLRNEKELDVYFDTAKGKLLKERLKKLALEEGIQKIRTDKIKVSMPNKGNGGRQFTWSSVAAYYGDVVEIANKFAPDEVGKYRQDIINFIPFAFSGEMSTILKTIPTLEEKELAFTNRTMFDKNSDARYLIPSTYIYLMREYKKRKCQLKSPKNILTSFLEDKLIPVDTRSSALEALGLFVEDSDKEIKALLEAIFEEREKGEEEKRLAILANELLINVFRDEKAVGWRLEEIKRPLEFDRKSAMGAHTPSSIELELDYMNFAKPLMKLTDKKYLSELLGLLDYSFKLQRIKAKHYQEYISYLWKIVISYIESLAKDGSSIPILELQDWIFKHARYKNINWLADRTKEIEQSFINNIRPSDKLLQAVEELNEVNSPVAQITYFILKAQFVEFKIKKLIEGMNFLLEKKTTKLPLYRKISEKSAKRIDEEFTLGMLINELKNYKGDSIEELCRKLEETKFKDKRNSFTHNFFKEHREIDKIAEEAKEYSIHADGMLELIQKVWRDISKSLERKSRVKI